MPETILRKTGRLSVLVRRRKKFCRPKLVWFYQFLSMPDILYNECGLRTQDKVHDRLVVLLLPYARDRSAKNLEPTAVAPWRIHRRLKKYRFQHLPSPRIKM